MTLDTIRSDFAFLDDWEDRYRYVIELGRGLPPLPRGLPHAAIQGPRLRQPGVARNRDRAPGRRRCRAPLPGRQRRPYRARPDRHPVYGATIWERTRIASLVNVPGGACRCLNSWFRCLIDPAPVPLNQLPWFGPLRRSFLRPGRFPLTPTRAVAVKAGRFFSGHRRLGLEGHKHDGTLKAIRGEAGRVGCSTIKPSSRPYQAA